MTATLPMEPVAGWPLERITQQRERYTAPDSKVEPGDCLRAAIASLLGMGLLDVPHFANIDRGVDDSSHAWWWAMVGWGALIEPAFDVIPIKWWQWPDPAADPLLGGCYILGGKSPRGEFNHAVVAREGRVIWDPHPSRAGLVNRNSAEVWMVRGDRPTPVLLGDPPDEAAPQNGSPESSS